MGYNLRKYLSGFIVTTFLASTCYGSFYVPNGSITPLKIAARPTGTSVSMGGFAISASSGGYTNATTTASNITNLSVTITTSGKPVMLMLISDGSGGTFADPNSSIGCSKVGDNCAGQINFKRGSTIIGSSILGGNGTGAVNYSVTIPASSVMIVDPVAAGTYTYTATGFALSSGATILVGNVKLLAYELL